MTEALVIILWCALSFPNYFIFKWGTARIRSAFGVNPQPNLDAGDIFLLALLLPFGPAGSLFGYFFTDWWCSGFEDDDERDDAPPQRSNRPSDPAIVADSRSWTGRA